MLSRLPSTASALCILPLHRGAYAECYALTSAALERDPYATECLPVHLASALELKKKTELFARGHK